MTMLGACRRKFANLHRARLHSSPPMPLSVEIETKQGGEKWCTKVQSLIDMFRVVSSVDHAQAQLGAVF